MFMTILNSIEKKNSRFPFCDFSPISWKIANTVAWLSFNLKSDVVPAGILVLFIIVLSFYINYLLKNNFYHHI